MRATSITRAGRLDLCRSHRARRRRRRTGAEALSGGDDTAPMWLSPDGCRLYMHRRIGTNTDVVVAER